MSDEQKPSDSADKAADGAFLAWAASHPTATLAREARLLDEIVRLRAENAALRAAVERVRAACENDLRWVDAQPILRALEETP